MEKYVLMTGMPSFEDVKKGVRLTRTFRAGLAASAVAKPHLHVVASLRMEANLTTRLSAVERPKYERNRVFSWKKDIYECLRCAPHESARHMPAWDGSEAPGLLGVLFEDREEIFCDYLTAMIRGESQEAALAAAKEHFLLLEEVDAEQEGNGCYAVALAQRTAHHGTYTFDGTVQATPSTLPVRVQVDFLSYGNTYLDKSKYLVWSDVVVTNGPRPGARQQLSANDVRLFPLVLQEFLLKDGEDMKERLDIAWEIASYTVFKSTVKVEAEDPREWVPQALTDVGAQYVFLAEYAEPATDLCYRFSIGTTDGSLYVPRYALPKFRLRFERPDMPGRQRSSFDLETKNFEEIKRALEEEVLEQRRADIQQAGKEAIQQAIQALADAQPWYIQIRDDDSGVHAHAFAESEVMRTVCIQKREMVAYVTIAFYMEGARLRYLINLKRLPLWEEDDLCDTLVSCTSTSISDVTDFLAKNVYGADAVDHTKPLCKPTGRSMAVRDFLVRIKAFFTRIFR